MTHLMAKRAAGGKSKPVRPPSSPAAKASRLEVDRLLARALRALAKDSDVKKRQHAKVLLRKVQARVKALSYQS